MRSGDLAASQAVYERAAEFAHQASAHDKLATAHRGFGEIARLNQAARHPDTAALTRGTTLSRDVEEVARVHRHGCR
ncbi:hypothetical protein [Amycolatopsis magusensis]|uniref:hypothetical protein n=1 Tax=Amycolatopsis magusensis TaxID=882444 RepID=UPI0037B0D632